MFGFGEFLASDVTDFYVSLDFGSKPLPDVFEKKERKWGAMYASSILGELKRVFDDFEYCSALVYKL